MNSANKIKLGAFILLAIILILGSFFSIGILKMFEQKFHAMTVLNTSVEGMTVGSAVKYMGVPVGRVSRIAMRDVDGYVDVYFSIFPSAMDSINKGEPIESSGKSKMDGVMKQKGLSCFINASGIMGGSYIELTLGAPAEYALPDLEVVPPEGFLYIPSRTSHISNAIQNISQTLQQLTKINLVELADKLNNTLDNANKMFSNPELPELLTRFNRISQDVEFSAKNLRQAFSDEQIQKLMKTVDFMEKSTQSLQKAFPEKKLEDISDGLAAFLKDAQEFLNSTGHSRDELVGDVNVLKQRMVTSLIKLDSLIKAIADFISSLEDDPNQFVRGRQDKPLLKAQAPQIKINH
ncbi:MAG: MlaD family protein [Victivallaceae bacterium]